MASITDDIKSSFQQGDALTRLVLVNLAVYVVYLLLRIVASLTRVPEIESYFVAFTALPSDLLKLATRPWTLVTYMFLHQGFLHILFNMLWLYFAGQLFMEYFGGRRLLSTFLIGGLIGGALYVVFYNIFPAFEGISAISNNRGASAGVMAIVVAIATYNPRFPVRLFFVLSVPLWGIAVGFVFLDLIGLGDGQNAGGRIAHFGGAAFGFFMARAYKEGRDLTEGFSQVMDTVIGWFKSKPKIKKVYTRTAGRGAKSAFSGNSPASNKAEDQKRMDEILDKISRSGYDSLTKDEKDHLFKIGRE